MSKNLINGVYNNLAGSENFNEEFIKFIEALEKI